MKRHVMLALACWLALPAAALAAETGKPAADPDEKLPAQLPSVTIQGRDLSGTGDRGNKVSPTVSTGASRIRLPEPAQRRATREDNRGLMVNVTPSTLEPPAALPGPRLPYTSLTAGWGPLTQYRLGLYDARMWGPALGITDLAGRAGWDWSGWHAKEALGWPGIGRADLQAHGFGWDRGGARGGQTWLAGTLEHGEGTDMLAGLDLDRGILETSRGGVATGSMQAMTGTARAQWRPKVEGEHQPQLDGKAQYRQWGIQNGGEGYASARDFWSLSDQVQLEGGLGGGYWGREAIVDPLAVFHYRPTPSSHLYAGLKTASELPNFAALYLNRGSSAISPDLQSERVEGWATLGGSHRLSEALWGSLDLGLRRSHRHIFWADTAGLGQWLPLNAGSEQWSPTANARLQLQLGDGPQIELGYAGLAVMPMGRQDHAIDAKVDTSFLEKRLDVSLGLVGRLATLSALQTPGGGSAGGAFALAEARYKITPDWNVGLHVNDVPLALTGLAAGYFAPNPWLTVNAQYQF
jgi:hypothetical protein